MNTITEKEFILLVECVERHSKVTGIMDKNRKRPVVYGRRIVMYILRYYYYLSLSQIARLVKRHHASVIHNLNQFQTDLMLVPELKKPLRSVVKELELEQRTINHLTKLLEDAKRRQSSVI